MSRRDWIVVLVAAAFLVGFPDLHESMLGLVLTGRCDHRGGAGAQRALRRGAEAPGLAPVGRAVIRRSAALAPSPRLA